MLKFLFVSIFILPNFQPPAAEAYSGIDGHAPNGSKVEVSGYEVNVRNLVKLKRRLDYKAIFYCSSEKAKRISGYSIYRKSVDSPAKFRCRRNGYRSLECEQTEAGSSEIATEISALYLCLNGPPDVYDDSWNDITKKKNRSSPSRNDGS